MLLCVFHAWIYTHQLLHACARVCLHVPSPLACLHGLHTSNPVSAAVCACWCPCSVTARPAALHAWTRTRVCMHLPRVSASLHGYTPQHAALMPTHAFITHTQAAAHACAIGACTRVGAHTWICMDSSVGAPLRISNVSQHPCKHPHVCWCLRVDLRASASIHVPAQLPSAPARIGTAGSSIRAQPCTPVAVQICTPAGIEAGWELFVQA